MRIYIAGPYSDDDPDRIARNIAAADTVAREIARLGHVPFCPHTMTAGWERDARLEYEDFMRIDRAWLECCEALVLLDGWRRSLGTMRELGWARARGLIIYARWEDVPPHV